MAVAAFVFVAMACGDTSASPLVRSSDPSVYFSASASDRTPMALQVRCDGKTPAAVYLHHRSVYGLPTMIDLRPGSPFHNAARIMVGWGLDLDRPDHQGAVSYWRHGTCGQGCVESQFSDRMIRSIKRNYTVHVLIEQDNGDRVDARFDLAGSRQRIESLCGPRLAD